MNTGCTGKRGSLGFETVLAARGKQQARTPCGEGPRCGEADAGAGSGDESDLLREVL
jgi:hypothetical protein